jgi:DNA helicase II / ATP-dependent DNA helicase PcrA
MSTAAIGFGPKTVKAKFEPSEYQQAVFDWVESRDGNHLIVEAVAGSGKTTTGVQIFNLLDKSVDSAFVAFNKHTADTLKDKLPEGSNARTYHSLGFATLKKTYPKMTVTPAKVEMYLSRKLTSNERWLKWSTLKLTSILKGHANYFPSLEALERIAFQYDVDTYKEKGDEWEEKIFDLTKSALAYSIDNLAECDFDDQIGLPNALDHVNFFQHDFLFVDEVQDTNNAQMMLALHSIAKGGSMIGVGDRKQSIYAFRGADETAMDKLREALEAEELPLSISYRCPKAIQKLVNTEFSEIKFEVPGWAKEGKVGTVSLDKLEAQLKPEDLVLCRVNADLVPVAFSLLRSGVKAIIRGRDIGKGLSALIRKSKATNAEDMYDWLIRWRDEAVQRAYRLQAEEKIQNINDQYDTLVAIGEGCKTVDEVAHNCEMLFSDENEGVVLSTIHRAKGLEANNVFILRPDLLPHPAAKTEVQINQERNLRYVAITRSKENLTWVY